MIVRLIIITIKIYNIQIEELFPIKTVSIIRTQAAPSGKWQTTMQKRHERKGFSFPKITVIKNYYQYGNTCGHLLASQHCHGVYVLPVQPQQHIPLPHLSFTFIPTNMKFMLASTSSIFSYITPLQCSIRCSTGPSLIGSSILKNTCI